MYISIFCICVFFFCVFMSHEMSEESDERQGLLLYNCLFVSGCVYVSVLVIQQSLINICIVVINVFI